VWRPSGYVGHQTVLYVHGYYTNVDEAWVSHGLPAQFAASGVGAVFVAPEAPEGNDEAVKWPSLPGLLTEVARQTGLAVGTPIYVIGHSGAFRTIAAWLTTPGIVKITLLDALYGNVADFVTWAAVAGRKLVTLSTPTGGTMANSQSIATKPNVEFIPTTAAHMALVTSGKFIPSYIRTMAGVAGGSALVLVIAVGAVAYLLWR
jgi:hypothetical protein